jgi:hypothetical protein
MPITFQTDLSRELTVFKITGTVNIREWLNTLRAYVESGTTRYELYDIREGEGVGFTSKQVDQIIEGGKSKIVARPPGSKTALVVSKDVHFGMSRVYQAVSEIEGSTWESETFRSMEEAYKWLGIDI